MKDRLKKTGGVISIGAIILVCACFTGIARAESNKNIYSGLLNRLLITSGISAEIIQLQRTDDYSNAISIKSRDENTIIIGIKRSTMDNNATFLVSIDGQEAIVEVKDDGSYTIVPEQDFDLATAICVIDSVITAIININNCNEDPLCIATNIFTAIIEIVACTGDIQP